LLHFRAVDTFYRNLSEFQTGETCDFGDEIDRVNIYQDFCRCS